VTELSRDIAGCRVKSQLAAFFGGGRRRASLDVCLRWLPVWLHEIWLAELMTGVSKFGRWTQDLYASRRANVA